MSTDFDDMPLEKDLLDRTHTNNRYDKDSASIISYVKLVAYLLIVVSVVVGIIMMSTVNMMIYGLIIVIGGIANSILILGFAQVISLLSDIKKNTSKNN